MIDKYSYPAVSHLVRKFNLLLGVSTDCHLWGKINTVHNKRGLLHEDGYRDRAASRNETD